MEQDEDDSAIIETRNLIELLEGGPEHLDYFNETLLPAWWS